MGVVSLQLVLSLLYCRHNEMVTQVMCIMCIKQMCSYFQMWFDHDCVMRSLLLFVLSVEIVTNIFNRKQHGQLLKLRIRCTNNQKGCEWVGELGDQ